jgi:HlyD family secretion protein
VDYTRLISHYDGVVTLRSFHDGDFIRSAADGGGTPVLAVAQTELMRVVIFVPDLDVPFVDRGDPATLRVDALQGQVFRGVVARFADVENEQKLMRTEVDLPNPDNRLRDGMYGTATIEVDPPSRNLRIPSSCLIEQSGQGQGAVYIVRDGKVHRQAVEVGQDNGGEVEIIGGLTADDEVVVRYNGTIDEGLVVQTDAVKAAPGGGKQP